MRRVIIDANTLASGSINPHLESATSLIFHELTGARLEVIICPELLAEVSATLHKSYFLDRVGEPGAKDILTGIASACTMLPDPAQVTAILRDPEDDYLVALARIAKAEWIITGDKDLLEHIGLKPPAISARNACELLGLIELH